MPTLLCWLTQVTSLAPHGTHLIICSWEHSRTLFLTMKTLSSALLEWPQLAKLVKKSKQMCAKNNLTLSQTVVPKIIFEARICFAPPPPRICLAPLLSVPSSLTWCILVVQDANREGLVLNVFQCLAIVCSEDVYPIIRFELFSSASTDRHAF